MTETEEVEAILRELKTYGATDQQIANYIDANRVTINRLRNGKPSKGETGASYLPALRDLLARARASQSQQLPSGAAIVDSLPPQQELLQLEQTPVQSTSRAVDVLRSQQIQEVDIPPQWKQHVVMPQSRELQEGDGYRPDTGHSYHIREIQSPYEQTLEQIHAKSNQRKREAEMEKNKQAQTGMLGGYGRYCRVCGLHPIGTSCPFA